MAIKAWKPRIKMEEGGGKVIERWRQVRRRLGGRWDVY